MWGYAVSVYEASGCSEEGCDDASGAECVVGLDSVACDAGSEWAASLASVSDGDDASASYYDDGAEICACVWLV